MKKTMNILMISLVVGMFSCSTDNEDFGLIAPVEKTSNNTKTSNTLTGEGNYPNSGDSNTGIEKYTDDNGDVAYIPAQFQVSEKSDERTIKTGLVVIGPDGSEYVWVPTTNTSLSQRNFGSFFSGGSSLSGYEDETSLSSYKEMVKSVAHYGGFYMGRYEASYGSGSSLSDYVPATKPVTQSQPGNIWVHFSPQNATIACENLYRDNPSVQGFFPWGANWDTTLQWFVDSGSKTYEQVASNSTSWGNYSDDTFSPNAYGNYTGVYEETKANNIYDMAGNNWEWTQERYGSSYVMRGGGYNLMGGACPGSRYPAALRDPLPGNSNHPNVCFRVGLYLTVESETSGIRQVTM